MPFVQQVAALIAVSYTSLRYPSIQDIEDRKQMTAVTGLEMQCELAMFVTYIIPPLTLLQVAVGRRECLSVFGWESPL